SARVSGVIALLQEDHRVLRGDVEPLSARLAGDRVVDADHVVAQLGEQRAVALVGAGRDPVLARADDPLHLIVVDALAARAGELVRPRLVLVVEEVAFVEGHEGIISARVGTYLPYPTHLPYPTS